MKHRRLIAIILTLTLLLGLLPASALADERPSTDTFCSATGGQHSWRNWTTDYSASCTEDGARSRVCGRCGYRQTETIKKTGHSWGKWKTTVEATCTRQGEQTRKCSACGKTETRKTDKLAHTWGEWTVITEPTDHSAGTRTRSCQVCGTEETQGFDPEGTLRRGDKGEAVKTLQEGLICYGVLTGSADGSFGPGTEAAVKAAQAAESLAADGVAWPQTQAHLGHRFGEWETLQEMTDFTTGIRQRVCSRCSHTETEETWPEPTYKRGDSGDGVKALQEKLNAAGYNCGTADGDFGGRTEAAVQALEAANGFTADGIAWPGVQKWLANPVEEISTYSNGASASDFLDKLRNGSNQVMSNPMPLTILTQPVGGDIDRDSGETLILSVEVVGGEEPYSYNWYKQFTFLENDGTSTTIGHWRGEDSPELPVDEPGRYYCKIIDAKETKVKTEIVDVTSELYIAEQPQNTSTCEMDPVILSCAAAGGEAFDNGTYIYAWYDETGSQVSFSDYGQFEVPGPGEYYCVVQDYELNSVTSQVAIVYDADPFEAIAKEETVYLTVGETYELWAKAYGGIGPYTGVWTRNGEVIPGLWTRDEEELPTQQQEDGIFTAPIIYAPIMPVESGEERYTFTAVDEMGDVATASLCVRYKQLEIAQQPQGGMLAQDGDVPVEINVVMAEGTEPFKYYLYHNGEPEVWGEDTGMSSGFKVWESGEYFIRIEDAEERWAETDKVLVKDFAFYFDSLTVSGPINGPDDKQTLTAVIVGGEEPPIGYKWFFNDDSWSIDISYSPIQTLNTDLPGTYYCKAVDGKGNVAISPSVQVEYTGDVPIITRQPQDLLLSYTQSGECSGELSCLALSGSPKNIYYTPISYTWERKGESGWLYNREQGPTIHVTEPGIYRCICRDTYSGLATVSNEVTVGVKLAYQKATIARTGGWGGRWVFYFTGGTGPFKVTTYWVRHCDIPGVDRVTEKVGTIDRESVSTLTIDMDRVIVPAGITDINGKYHKYEYVALYVVVRDSAGQKANSPVILMRN